MLHATQMPGATGLLAHKSIGYGGAQGPTVLDLNCVSRHSDLGTERATLSSDQVWPFKGRSNKPPRVCVNKIDQAFLEDIQAQVVSSVR